MIRIQGLGVLTLGMALGAGIVALGGRTEAQTRTVQSVEEINSRFVVSDDLRSMKGKHNYWFTFMRDRQTGDCYLTYKTVEFVSTVLTKTDDNACEGF